MAEKARLRVMLVDDSSETRRYLQQLLQFEAHVDLVGTASNGQEAVELARETRPEMILMDINMPVMDGISAAEIISSEMPAVRIVMMSVQSEMAYLRRAMQAGAREYLFKPFTHDELMNILGEVSSLTPSGAEITSAAPTLDRVAAPAQPLQEATLIAVFSPRGGAGCSTIALNLAVALQGQRKAKVLIIDGNLRFGALDAMLNLQITHSIADLIPLLDAGDNDPEILHTTTLPHTSGIRLLAAPPSPEMADMISPQHFEKIVSLGQQRYDYVIADLGTRLDDRALHFMDLADTLFVILTPDIPAIKNVRLFLEITHSLDYNPEKISLVLNQAAPRSGITAEAVERHIKHPVAFSIPDNPRLVQTAMNRGVPLMLYEREIDKDIPVTRRLLALSNIVPEPKLATESDAVPQKSLADAPDQEKKQGFLGKIFGRG